MKKSGLLVILFICLFNGVFAQHGYLGFKKDINAGIFNVNYNVESRNTSNNLLTEDTKIRFYNANFRYGGSIIGSAIFKHSRFFFGEYLQGGVGVGIGKKTSTTGANYTGTTFNALFGVNLGIVTSYAVSDNLVVGLKAIAWGADMYFDFDETPMYYNVFTFHPTVQYRNFWGSIGYGGLGKGDSMRTFETEFRFNFSSDMSESMYLGFRLQSNKVKTTVISTDGLNSNHKTGLTSVGITFGYCY